MTTKEAHDFATKINGPMTAEQAREFIGMLELGRSRITLERGETAVSGVVIGMHGGAKAALCIERIGVMFLLSGEFAWTVRGVK